MNRKVYSALTIFLLATSVHATDHNLGFEAGEHLAIGDEVKLYFTPNNPVQPKLHVANGLVLSYGDIVSLGDFYEIPGQTITQSKTQEERNTRFIAAYNSFAQNPAAVSEATKILAISHDEQNAILTGIKNGEKPEVVYQRISGENNRLWSCATGGSCAKTGWFLQPGRYVSLASQDFDHFGANAWLTYQTGHALALQTAIAAHQTQDTSKLETAYAMNGFASHFLSDYFAAGHMRTPRTELPSMVTPSLVGTLLVSFMHNEENNYGLHLHNARGDHWVGYGDRYYFNPIDDANSRILREAMQASADEIFSAYETGMVPENKVAQLIPYPDEVGSAAQQDIAPLFYWDANAKKLMRRVDTANAYSHQWTADWWGWTTLIKLAQQRGLPVESQAQLVKAGYGEKAMRAGLITDKSLMSYVGSH